MVASSAMRCFLDVSVRQSPSVKVRSESSARMIGRHTGTVVERLHPLRPQVRQAHPDLCPLDDSHELASVLPR